MLLFHCAREAFANRSANLLAPSHFYRRVRTLRSAVPKHCLFEPCSGKGAAFKISYQPAQLQAAVPVAGATSAAGLAPAGFFLPGAIIMIIWRPSSLGNCSMMMLSKSHFLRAQNPRIPIQKPHQTQHPNQIALPLPMEMLKRPSQRRHRKLKSK